MSRPRLIFIFPPRPAPTPTPTTLRTRPSPPLRLIPRARVRTTKFSSSAKNTNNKNPNTTATNHTKKPTTTEESRTTRILSRLPPRLRSYASRLRGAPVSHLAAFLLLHELTAVVPLLGLFALFHYVPDLVGAPLGWVVRHYGGYVREGVARFERYFTKKGWFGFGPGSGSGSEGVVSQGEGKGEGEGEKSVLERWEEGRDAKYRVVVEVALAWAITKALLPARIVVSLWATPWFAGVLVRLRGLVGFRR